MKMKKTERGNSNASHPLPKGFVDQGTRLRAPLKEELQSKYQSPKKVK